MFGNKAFIGAIVLLISTASVISSDSDMLACTGVTGCVTFPTNCKPETCDLAVNFRAKDDKNILVTVFGKSQSPTPYIAVGFSKDAQMGQDAVIACRNNGNVATMINPGQPGDHRPTEPNNWVSGKPSSFSVSSTKITNAMECSFVLPNHIDAGNGIAFDLIQDNVNVFVVSGPANPGGGLAHHTSKVLEKLTPGTLAITGGNPSPAAGPTTPTSPTTSTTTSTDPTPNSAMGSVFSSNILGLLIVMAFCINF